MPLDLCSDLFSWVTSAGLRNFNSYSMLHSQYVDPILISTASLSFMFIQFIILSHHRSPSTILLFFFLAFSFPKQMYNQKMRSGDDASRTKLYTYNTNPSP